MKTLSSRQIDEVLYFITDLIIANNPEKELDEDVVYDNLLDYWLESVIEEAMSEIFEG